MSQCNHHHPSYGNRCTKNKGHAYSHSAGEPAHGNHVTWDSAKGKDLKRALNNMAMHTQSDFEAAVAEARRAAFEECANLVAKMCPCPVMSGDEEDEGAIRTYGMIEQAIRAKAAT